MNTPPSRTLAALLSLVLSGCQNLPPNGGSETRPLGEPALSAAAQQAAQAAPAEFATHIKPILESRCAMCHNAEALPGKVDLSSREAAARTGALGVWIVPGKPDQSLLVPQIGEASPHPKDMPPVGNRVTAAETAVLRKGITEGAVWPAGRAGRLRVLP